MKEEAYRNSIERLGCCFQAVFEEEESAVAELVLHTRVLFPLVFRWFNGFVDS